MRCRRRGPRSARPAVRGVAAASERASAATGAGDGGPAARAWRGPRGGRGERGQRDHGAQGRRRTGVRRGPVAGRAGASSRRWTQARRRARSGAGAALLGLVEPDERGDPMSPLRWTTKSLRHLADELARQGHPVSAPTVGRLLRDNGFSLQGNGQDAGGRPAPRSGRPVPLHQRAGQGPPGRRRAGDQRGCEEEGAARAATRGRAGVAPEGRPGPGRGPQLLHRRPGRASWPSPTASTTSPPTPAG